jgi:hypothetical protein
MTTTTLPASSTSPQVLATLVGALTILILGAAVAIGALMSPAPIPQDQPPSNWVIERVGGFQEFAP